MTLSGPRRGANSRPRLRREAVLTRCTAKLLAGFLLAVSVTFSEATGVRAIANSAGCRKRGREASAPWLEGSERGWKPRFKRLRLPAFGCFAAAPRRDLGFREQQGRINWRQQRRPGSGVGGFTRRGECRSISGMLAMGGRGTFLNCGCCTEWTHWTPRRCACTSVTYQYRYLPDICKGICPDERVPHAGRQGVAMSHSCTMRRMVENLV